MIQLTPAVLARTLEGMTEKLRSGVKGKVRDAIQQSIARILVGADGSVTVETKPDGLLGVKGIHIVSGPALALSRGAVASGLLGHPADDEKT